MSTIVCDFELEVDRRKGEKDYWYAPWGWYRSRKRDVALMYESALARSGLKESEVS